MTSVAPSAAVVQAAPQPPAAPQVPGPLSPREVRELQRDLVNAGREARAAQAQVEAAQRAADAELAAERAQGRAADVGAPNPNEVAAAQAAADRAAAEAGTPAPGVTTIIGEDGTVTRYENGQPTAAPPLEGVTIAAGRGERAQVAEQVKEMVGIAGGMLVGAMTIFLFFRTIQKWIAARAAPGALPRDAMDRLARIENAIEAMAVEVERISEGQRFTTRLLSEKSPVERAG